MNNLPNRKSNRLKNYDYSTPGSYFITICVKDRKQILSEIIFTDDARIIATNNLTSIGLLCNKYINNISTKYENVSVDKYVIMPNHIHMIISLCGTMKASSPTRNIENIIRSFKIMVTKEIGKSIWQRSFHDHIIRNETDYLKIWEYIDTNVVRWKKDCFYTFENE